VFAQTRDGDVSHANPIEEGELDLEESAIPDLIADQEQSNCGVILDYQFER